MNTPHQAKGTADIQTTLQLKRGPGRRAEVTLRRMRTQLLAAASCLLLASPVMAALECKPVVESHGTDVLKAVATALATNAWPARATLKYGVKFANWSNATNKSTSCKLETSPVGVNVWLCTVAAKPCILK